ncbi:hypothetical protein DAI22_03g378032 [Oryza sativa Japonica Group]|nr:hypothetical protein DAI22_03g378032 [Oryza sativa Japonica Group]
MQRFLGGFVGGDAREEAVRWMAGPRARGGRKGGRPAGDGRRGRRRDDGSSYRGREAGEREGGRWRPMLGRRRPVMADAGEGETMGPPTAGARRERGRAAGGGAGRRWAGDGGRRWGELRKQTHGPTQARLLPCRELRKQTQALASGSGE